MNYHLNYTFINHFLGLHAFEEKGNEYIYTRPVPGCDADDIKIEVSEPKGVIRIVYPEDAEYVPSGTYDCLIEGVKKSMVEKKVENGVLTITVKKEDPKWQTV